MCIRDRLTGHLPFNDDNIKKLLLKVQSGKYQMPMNLSAEARDLISKILVIDPAKRITTQEILKHPLIKKYDDLPVNKILRKMKRDNMARGKSNSDLHLLNNVSPSIVTLYSRSDIDESILRSLQILWHGVSRELITAKLLQKPMSEEKLFYSLLLQYKQRHSISLSSASEHKKSAKESSINESKIEHTAEISNSTNEGNNNDVKTPHSLEVHSENTSRFNNNDTSISVNPEINAPVLTQKSQFSLNTLSHQDNDKLEAEIVTLPSAIPIFNASSSRVFRNSYSSISSRSKRSLRLSKSRLSLSASTSKDTVHDGEIPPPQLPKSPSRYSLSRKAIHTSPSNKTINKSLSRNNIAPTATVRRTLQNSASKRSLYSLQSISKRSLNLNDLLVFDDPLPSKISTFENASKSKPHSLESDSDFEILCDQILFGNALDKILEEEEDNERENDTQRQRRHVTNNSSDTITVSDASLNKENAGSKNPTKIGKNPSNMFREPLEEISRLSSFPIFQKENSINSTFLENQKPKRTALSDITNSFNETNEQFFKNKDLGMEKRTHKEQLQRKNGRLSSFKPIQSQELRINSLPNKQSKPSPSLDPRRNVSQPLNSKVESLLQGTKFMKEPPSQCNHESGSLFMDKCAAGETPGEISDDLIESSYVPLTMVASPSRDPSILAESSTCLLYTSRCV